ncbi:hypothetical protein AAC387_Pa03g4435 [Persea americana]
MPCMVKQAHIKDESLWYPSKSQHLQGNFEWSSSGYFQLMSASGQSSSPSPWAIQLSLASEGEREFGYSNFWVGSVSFLVLLGLVEVGLSSLVQCAASAFFLLQQGLAFSSFAFFFSLQEASQSVFPL